MRLVSPFLKRVVYPSLAAAGMFHRTAAKGLAVVTYHGVLPDGYQRVDSALDGNLVSAETLGQHLRLLKAHYNVVDPEDVLAWHEGRLVLPPRAVLVTCDDGLLNHLTEMLPVLQQERVKCLFFVTGASGADERSMLWYEELFLLFLRAPAGPFEVSGDGITISADMGTPERRRRSWWDAVKRLSQADAGMRAAFLSKARSRYGIGVEAMDVGAPTARRFQVMNRAEVRALDSAGMTVGAHTITHPVLSQLPLERVRAEISGCRTELEAVLQKPIWAFAYPFGDAGSVSAEVLKIPLQAGFRVAFLNYGGGLGAALPAYAIPRIHVTSEMKLAELEAHVSGFYTRCQQYAGRTA